MGKHVITVLGDLQLHLQPRRGAGSRGGRQETRGTKENVYSVVYTKKKKKKKKKKRHNVRSPRSLENSLSPTIWSANLGAIAGTPLLGPRLHAILAYAYSYYQRQAVDNEAAFEGTTSAAQRTLLRL